MISLFQQIKFAENLWKYQRNFEAAKRASTIRYTLLYKLVFIKSISCHKKCEK